VYSPLLQIPRFVAIAAAVLIVIYGNAWWSLPAWMLAVLGSGCPRIR